MASKKNAEHRGGAVRLKAAMQGYHQYTLWDRIECQTTARTLTMLKTNAITRHSNKSSVGSL